MPVHPLMLIESPCSGPVASPHSAIFCIQLIRVREGLLREQFRDAFDFMILRSDMVSGITRWLGGARIDTRGLVPIKRASREGIRDLPWLFMLRREGAAVSIFWLQFRDLEYMGRE